MSKKSNMSEQDFKNLCENYSITTAKAALLLLLDSVLEALPQDFSNLFEIPKQCSEISNDLNKVILNLENALELENEAEKASEKISSLMASIMEIYLAFCPCRHFADKSNMLFKAENALKRYKSEPEKYKDISVESLLALCGAFIDDAREPEVFNARVTALLEALPFNMERNKFFAILKARVRAYAVGLGLSESNACESFEKMLKAAYFNANELTEFYFPETVKLLDEKIQLRPADLDDDEFASAVEDAEHFMDAMSSMNFYLDCMYNNLCCAKILLLNATALDELFSGDLVFKDIFYTSCDILRNKYKGEELAEYLELLAEKTEDVISPLLDKMLELNDKIRDYIENADFSAMDNATFASLRLSTELRELFYDDLASKLFSSGADETESAAISQERLEAIAQNYIDEQKLYLSQLNPKLRKTYMSCIFAAVLPFSTDEELFAYMQTCIEEIYAPEQKLVFFDKLVDVFDVFNFSPEDSHSHHHEEGCSCGGLHNHNHDCGCGHSHHECGHN